MTHTKPSPARSEVLKNWLEANAVPGVLESCSNQPGDGFALNGYPVAVTSPESRDDYFMIEASSGDQVGVSDCMTRLQDHLIELRNPPTIIS